LLLHCLLLLLLAVLLVHAHTFHQILGELCEFHVSILIFRALRIAVIDQIPETTHDLSMLRLHRVIEMGKLLNLISSYERRLLLRYDALLVVRSGGAVHPYGRALKLSAAKSR
jgi:hypothetical protein